MAPRVPPLPEIQRRGRRRWWRLLRQALTSRRAWQGWRGRLVYAVLTLPLAAAYALLVVGLVAAVITALQLVGVVVLPLVLALARGLGGLERWQATRLLRVEMAAGVRLRREEAPLPRRVLMLLTAGSTWRTVAWLAVRVLLGAGLVAAPAAATGVWLAVVVEQPWSSTSVAGGIAGVLVSGALAGAVLISMDLQVRVAAAVAPHLLGAPAQERLLALQRESRELADRNRLARDLHDTIGHTLTASLLQAEAARRMLDPDPLDATRPTDVDFARQALEHIESTTRDALGELDHALAVLRGATPPGEAHLLPAADLTSLAGLLAGLRDGGLPVTLTVDGSVDGIPPPLSEVAYRVVQEGTTNVLRHAGPAPTEVALTREPRALTVLVRNSPGSARASRPGSGGGRGLGGLRERVTAVGGQMTAEPEPDGGFALRARIPLPRRG